MVMTVEEIEKAIIDLASKREGLEFEDFEHAFDSLVYTDHEIGIIGYIDYNGHIATISLVSQGKHGSDEWYVYQVSQMGTESQHFAVWGHEEWELVHWSIVETSVINDTIYPEPLISAIKRGVETGGLKYAMRVSLEQIKALVEEVENTVSIANTLAPDFDLEIPGELVDYLPTHPETN